MHLLACETCSRVSVLLTSSSASRSSPLFGPASSPRMNACSALECHFTLARTSSSCEVLLHAVCCLLIAVIQSAFSPRMSACGISTTAADHRLLALNLQNSDCCTPRPPDCNVRPPAMKYSRA